MSARRLELGARARRDLVAIWSWTDEHWNAEQAERYIDKLNAAMRDLASGTRIGHAAKVTGYLRFGVNAHAIYFRTSGTMVQVVRALHQRQNAEQHLPRSR